MQITDPGTSNCEFGNLLMIKDNYPKYVITLNDIIIGNDYFGIKKLDLLEFLCSSCDIIQPKKQGKLVQWLFKKQLRNYKDIKHEIKIRF